MKKFIPRKILHIKLDREIPALSNSTPEQQLYVVLWWREIPLGHLEFSPQHLPLSAKKLTNLAIGAIAPAVNSHLGRHNSTLSLLERLKNPVGNVDADLNSWLEILDHPLTKLDRLHSKKSDRSRSVSVVICTRDRTQQLSECLTSLENLIEPPEEIIVVDNAPSSDATRQLVRQMPGVKYILEPQPGLDVARNAGIAYSSSEIVAFTDDDVKIHPQWLSRLRRSFQEPTVMAVTGLTLPAELETESQLIFEKYWSFNRGYQQIDFNRDYFERRKSFAVPVWKIGAGANMAFRREAFELVGYFDERLDMGAAGCSGDSEIWYRILAEGGTCRYDPTAVVYHYHRRDLDSLKKQMYCYMRGHVTALLIQFEKYHHWGNLRRLFVALPKWYVKLFFKGLIKGFQVRHKTLFAEVLGCLSGIRFYLQNRPNNIKQSYPVTAKQILKE